MIGGKGLMEYRRYSYFGKNFTRPVGKIVMASQPEGLRVRVITDPYIPAEVLKAILPFWFGDYDLKISDLGAISITIPRNEKYGVVLNKLAKAIYQIQQGYKPPDPTQTQLTREAA